MSNQGSLGAEWLGSAGRGQARHGSAGILHQIVALVTDAISAAAEVVCPRDHSCEERLRSWESAAEAVEDEICDEAEADEDYLYATTWSEYRAKKAASADNPDEAACEFHSEWYRKSDPGEVAAPAPGERVTIPVLPPDEAGARPNDWDAVMAAYDAVAEWLDRADNGAALIGCTPSMVAGVAIKAYRTALLSVGHEDLSAHLTGAAIRANTGHPDVLIDAFASSLLADYRITRK